jgi:hypothetical protein
VTALGIAMGRGQEHRRPAPPAGTAGALKGTGILLPKVRQSRSLGLLAARRALGSDGGENGSLRLGPQPSRETYPPSADAEPAFLPAGRADGTYVLERVSAQQQSVPSPPLRAVSR